MKENFRKVGRNGTCLKKFPKAKISKIKRNFVKKEKMNRPIYTEKRCLLIERKYIKMIKSSPNIIKFVVQYLHRTMRFASSFSTSSSLTNRFLPSCSNGTRCIPVNQAIERPASLHCWSDFNCSRHGLNMFTSAC